MADAHSTNAALEHRAIATARKTLAALTPAQSLALLLLISLLVRIAILPVMMNKRDRRDYIGSAQKAVRYGVTNFYENTEGDRANRQAPVPYPPIPVYFYWLAGYIYQHGFDPGFRDTSKWKDVPCDSLALNYLIEIPIFLFELLLTAVIFLFVRRRVGDTRALLCAGLYALNPAILCDGVMWAQPDAVHSFFLTLAVVFVMERKPVLCLPMLSLAVLSKPQPTVIVLAILIIALLTSSGKQALQGLITSCITATFVLLPFVVLNAQAIPKMVRVISSAHPYVSVNAHNFWWLITSSRGTNPRWLADDTIVFGGMTYLGVSVLIFFCLYTTMVTKAIRASAEYITAEPFAYIGFTFFIFAVRMHENHSIQVIPLLLLTGLTLRHQRVIFAILTLTISANLMLHSQEFIGSSVSVLQELRAGNAALNVAAFLYWGYHFFRGSLVDFANATRRRLALMRD